MCEHRYTKKTYMDIEYMCTDDNAVGIRGRPPKPHYFFIFVLQEYVINIYISNKYK